MLDRVSISQDETGPIHYDLKQPDGVLYLSGVIPLAEWNVLRNSVIETLSAHSDSRVVDLLTVLAVIADLDCEPSAEV